MKYEIDRATGLGGVCKIPTEELRLLGLLVSEPWLDSIIEKLSIKLVF